MTLRTRNGEERLSVTSEKVLVLLLRTIYGSRRKDVVFVGKCRQLGLWFAARWHGRFMAAYVLSRKVTVPLIGKIGERKQRRFVRGGADKRTSHSIGLACLQRLNYTVTTIWGL